jgi:hypothetical protein
VKTAVAILGALKGVHKHLVLAKLSVLDRLVCTAHASDNVLDWPV